MFYGDQRPPHFHAVYGDGEIVVELQSGAIDGRFLRRALLLVLEWLDAHRDELSANWARPESDLAPAKLEPLP